jgi:trans-aconitate methyltransferase
MDSNKLGELFGEYYYAHNCGQPYAHNQRWLNLFNRIADRIVSDLNPQTVLDAGCAWGLLVECLRARGVEAYGIDISEYAINNVDESVRPFCWVGSIAEPFPQSYDLIVSVEVLEHMPKNLAELAIENLSKHSDQLLISTSPHDFQEATHINVQQPDYWSRQFARCGFYKDLDFDASFITPWAARYYRSPQNTVPSVIQAYERKLWQSNVELMSLRSSVIDYHKKLQEKEVELSGFIENPSDPDRTRVGADSMKQQLNEVKEERDEMARRILALEARWADLEKNRTWKILRAFQSVRTRLFPPESKREKFIKRIVK